MRVITKDENENDSANKSFRQSVCQYHGASNGDGGEGGIKRTSVGTSFLSAENVFASLAIRYFTSIFDFYSM